MIRNFTFALLGLLVGLAIFTYGVTLRKPSNKLAANKAATPNVEELQKNVIIDPVEITNPNVPAEEAKTAAATANNQATQAAPAGQVASAAQNSSATAAATPGLASEIIPVPPVEEPAYEGWANAAFLPEDAEEDNSALEEEVVE